MNIKYTIYILLFVHECVTFDVPKSACKTNLTIDKNIYNVFETYDIGDAYPTDAHYDAYGNLFFVEYRRKYKGYILNVKVIKQNTTEPQNIPGLPEDESYYSIAVDKNNTYVYFGTSKGIFVYNYDINQATLLSSPDLKLLMFYIDQDGKTFINKLPGDKMIRIIINAMAIDDNNNFYYIKEDKLYVFKADVSKVILIGNVSYKGFAQISFYEEIVYVASDTLSYIHENDTGPLKLVQNIPGKVTAISFDNAGNFILGTYGKIFKYNATNNKECYHREN